MKSWSLLVATFSVALIVAASGIVQSASGMSRVGVVMWGAPDQDPYIEPFRTAMQELGYVEGQNIRLEVRWARGSSQQALAFAGEFVREKVDVIVANTTPVAHIAKEATADIPIVMAPVADPLATGLVTNLARPLGNLTGVSTFSPDLAAKRLEIVREMIPALRRAAFLGSQRDPNAQTFLRQMERAASAFGVEMIPVLVDDLSELENAFTAMVGKGAEAVLVQPILVGHSETIAQLAARHRLPAATSYRAAPHTGVLFNYGANVPRFMKQAAAQVDKLLKGAKVSEVPVEQPTHFELVINLETASLLGLAVPPALLAQADEVIE
jgi:putative tryptophan/tyrosine transport system substrate-binding protein